MKLFNKNFIAIAVTILAGITSAVPAPDEASVQQDFEVDQAIDYVFEGVPTNDTVQENSNSLKNGDGEEKGENPLTKTAKTDTVEITPIVPENAKKPLLHDGFLLKKSKRQKSYLDKRPLWLNIIFLISFCVVLIAKLIEFGVYIFCDDDLVDGSLD